MTWVRGSWRVVDSGSRVATSWMLRFGASGAGGHACRNVLKARSARWGSILPAYRSIPLVGKSPCRRPRSVAPRTRLPSFRKRRSHPRAVIHKGVGGERRRITRRPRGSDAPRSNNGRRRYPIVGLLTEGGQRSHHCRTGLSAPIPPASRPRQLLSPRQCPACGSRLPSGRRRAGALKRAGGNGARHGARRGWSMPVRV